MRKILDVAFRALCVFIFVGILLITRDCLSAFDKANKPIEMDCPTAVDRLGKRMPAIERFKKVGVYMIDHCDGSIRLDTVTENEIIKFK